MRVTEKGQVTIPNAFATSSGSEGTEVEFRRDDDAIVIRKLAKGPTRGSRLVQRLRRRGDVALTTEEIMALTRQP